MMINQFSLCVLVALFASQVHANSVHVYLQAGQSNADGRAESSGLPTSPVDLQQTQTDVKFFFCVQGDHPLENRLIDLQPGSPEHNQTNFFGPEITFGRDMADFYASDPSVSVAIIKYANGGTNLHSQWKAGGTGSLAGDGSEYVSFQNTVTAGLAAIQAANPGDTVVISGMIWHQGEADSHNSFNVRAYQKNLTNFIIDIRATYAADLPFIIGEIADNGTSYQAIRAAQKAVAAADLHTGFVDVDEFAMKDEVHFDANGQQSLGSGFAAQIQTLPEPTLPPATAPSTTPSFTVAIAPSVFAHWSFDKDYSDVSGNRNDGTAFDGNTDGDTDGVSITNTEGEYKFGGGAANFAAERDYIDIPKQTFHSGNEYSVAFWAKRDNASTWDMVIGQPDNRGFFIGLQNEKRNKIRWRSGGKARERQADFAAKADIAWHHYVIVAGDADSDSSVDDISFYCDGVLVGTDNDNKTGFYFDAIGEAYTSGDDFDFHGQIDEIWIFDKAIDAATVSNLYNVNAPVHDTQP